MKLDFERIPEMKILEYKDGKGITVARTYVDNAVKMVKGYLEPGSSIGMHSNEFDNETLFILSGQGVCIHNGRKEKIVAGACRQFVKGDRHSLINTGRERLFFYSVMPQI